MVQVQIPSVQTAMTQTIRDKINYRVRVRTSWLDPWETVDYLEPIDAEWNTSPSVQRATFVFKYGEVSREDRQSFALEANLKLQDKFVLIERFAVTPPVDEAGFGPVLEEKTVPLFYGQITIENYQEHNLRTTATDTGASGDQTIIAYGLEQMLDRVIINQALIENDAESAIEFIDWVMPFNRRLKRGQPVVSGNRSTNKYARTIGPVDVKSFVFNGKPTVGNIWTNLDIAEYLLTMYSPGDELRGDINFRLSGQTDALAGLVMLSLDLEGMTIRQALNELIDRRRGVGWTIRVDKNDVINVHVFTVLDEPISTKTVTIPANAQKIGLDLNGRVDIKRIDVIKDSATAYDAIIILGELIQTTFSLDTVDLQPGWTAQDESDYLAANDDERNSDKFAHVFSLFKIRKDWDWLDINGNICNPKVNPLDGSLEPTVQAALRNWDRRILRNLPFLKQRDAADPDAEPEQERPLVFIDNPRKPGEPMQADRIEETIRELDSASIRASDTEFGLYVNFNPNHILAKNRWVGAAKTNEKPKLDFDGMIATISVETDVRLKLVILNTTGFDPDSAVDRPGRVKTIYVPDAHLWYVVGGTVRQIIDEAGSLGFVPEPGGELRNDIDRLENIAALARAWYGKRRTAISIRWNDITTAYPPGAFLNAVSNVFDQADQVGAVITDVNFDFAKNQTTIRTGFLELDAQGFV